MMSDQNISLLLLLVVLLFVYIHIQSSPQREGFVRALRPSLRNFRLSRTRFKKRIGNSFIRAKRNIFGIKL